MKNKEKPDLESIIAGLGANERALLERIPSVHLRRLAARGIRVKLKLQFTGWLQYLMPLVAMILLALVGGLAYLFGLVHVAFGLLLIAGGLLGVAVFDLVTVKFRLRFPERRPPSNTHLDCFDLMRARRSCRSYQTRLMREEDRISLLASVQRHTETDTLGPTPVRLEFIRARLTVWPVVNATEFLIAIVPLPYDRRSVIDVGRTLQKVVMDATRQGLATCWIGPGADHKSLEKHLGDRFDPEHEQIICTCAVGYRSRYVPLFLRLFNRITRNRLALSELFFSDEALSVPVDVDAPPYNQFGRTYEICQWAPSSYNGQTTRAVVRSDAELVKSVDFYAVTSSHFYAPVALGIWCANWELGCNAVGFRGHFALPQGHGAAKESTPIHDVTWMPATGVRR